MMNTHDRMTAVIARSCMSLAACGPKLLNDSKPGAAAKFSFAFWTTASRFDCVEATRNSV
jgi:hypothetical protein